MLKYLKRKVVEYTLQNRSYALIPFYKQIDENCWQIQVVITQNFEPFFEVIIIVCIFKLTLLEIEDVIQWMD